MTYLDTSYKNYRNVVADLAYLGVTRVRDGVPTWYRTAYRALAAAGISFDFLTSGSDISGTVATLAGFAGSLSAVEGPNEVNL